MGSRYEKYDETKFLDLLQTEFEKEEREFASEYAFSVKKSEEEQIRFYLPEYYSSYSKFDFENKYFETDFANFSKILIK